MRSADHAVASVPPRRVLVIAAVPRSGSSLLASALDTTGVAGHPREYLSEPTLHDARREHHILRLTARGHLGRLRRRLRGDPAWHLTYRFTRRSFLEYLRGWTPTATTANGVLGLKVHWVQYQWAMLRRGLDAGWWGVPVTWVLLTRDDRLRQAISLVRARQTGWWEAAIRKPPREPDSHFDHELIGRTMAELDEQVSGWEQYFTERRISPLRVTHEQLVADYEATVRSVLRHLGVDAAIIPAPPLARQADDRTEEWVARYQAATD